MANKRVVVRCFVEEKGCWMERGDAVGSLFSEWAYERLGGVLDVDVELVRAVDGERFAVEVPAELAAALIEEHGSLFPRVELSPT